MNVASRKPHARYDAIKTAVEHHIVPIDVQERALFDLLQGNGTNEVVAYAHELYARTFRREILQAWIVSGATDEQILNCLRVPAEVVASYRFFFFDLSVFRDDLELFEWVENYNGTPNGRTLLMQATMSGVNGLMWLYNRGNLKLDPKEVIRKAMTDAHFRANAGRFSSVTSKEADAAHKHLKTAMSAAGQLAKGDTGNLLSDLLIRLQHRDDTTPITPELADNLLH